MMRFEDFASTHGVLIRDLHAARSVKRCGTLDHPRGKDGAYLWDGDRGWVMAWDGDAQVHWFEDETKPWSAAEKAAWLQRRDATRLVAERKWQRAADTAQEMLNRAQVKTHAYLQYKGLKESRAFVLPDDTLVVPMRSLGEKLMGLQTIRWLPTERKWEKKMLPGMRGKGAVFRLGRGPLSVLCEGYATGLSIELAVRQTAVHAETLVCFSASNLEFVAPMLGKRAIVFADHDASGTGERSAKATGLAYCMSDVLGEDANDLHYRAGLLAVRAALMRCLVSREEEKAADFRA